VPFYSSYLGSSKQDLRKYEAVDTQDGYVIPLKKDIKHFLLDLEVHSGNLLEDCLEFLDRNDVNDYHYFIVIEG
jgi:hypothetical protein